MANTERPTEKETTARPASARKGRASARAEAREGALDEQQLDLLTAALIGVVVGAGAALVLRRGPSGRRPLVPMLQAAGRGARWTGEAAVEGARWLRPKLKRSARLAAKRASAGAEWARDRGEAAWDSGPVEAVRDYAEAAREAIADTVDEEMRSLRKAIRQQRRRLGV